MTIEIKLPALGENIESGQIVQLLVQMGDVIARDQTVMEIETAKTNLELPSPAAGRVVSIAVAVGQTVTVGQVLLTLEESASAARTAMPAAPRARQLAREMGIPIEEVGGGPSGRISVEDVKRHARETAKSAAVGAAPGAPGPALPDFSAFGEVERQPLGNVRLLIAQQMGRSWSSIPHVMLERKADVTELEAFRQRRKGEVETAGGRLTLTSLLVKIAAQALRAFPRVNASLDLDAQEIVLKKYVHIGVAADTPRGLLVPVVRDVDSKSITQVSVELAQLVERARAGKLQPSELQGACFSVTNLGGLGVGHFTALINPPEVAVLAVGKAEMEPVFDGKELKPRLMMPLSLSIDHRALDGADGARFLGWIVSAIEEPFLMALG